MNTEHHVKRINAVHWPTVIETHRYKLWNIGAL